MGGLFFQADGAARGIELDDAVGGWILHRVGEDGGAAVARRGAAAQELGHVLAVEDVVAEDEGAGLAGDEALADEEGLGEAFGTGLLGIFEFEAPLLAASPAVRGSAADRGEWR